MSLKNSCILFIMIGFTLAATPGCSPIKEKPDTVSYSFKDIPISRLRKNAADYVGKVFSGRLKFYRIYQGVASGKKVKRGTQITLGMTHFTARLMDQYAHVIRIRISPEQKSWLQQQGIARQDIIDAKVRFAEISVGNTLAFDLVAIKTQQGNWK